LRFAEVDVLRGKLKERASELEQLELEPTTTRLDTTKRTSDSSRKTTKASHTGKDRELPSS